MPKIVDRDRRRAEIVAATWRIIATEGIERATMREIAAEAGLANGAIKPYFASKDDLLAAAFEHVFNRTNERIAVRTSDMRGIPALVALCHEVLPLDAERVNEARIVIAFWQTAMSDPAKVRFHDEALNQWRGALLGYLTQARELGQIATSLDDAAIVEQLLTLMIGAQVLAALGNHTAVPGQFEAQLEVYLGRLRPEPSAAT